MPNVSKNVPLLNLEPQVSTITIMQNYMLTVLVKNELAEKERVALLDDIKKQFGELKKEDLWGARGLAYPINHQEKAFFAHFEFQQEPSKILALDKMVKLNEDIMRYLLTRVEISKKVVKPRKEVKKQADEKTEEVTEELAKDGDTKLE